MKPYDKPQKTNYFNRNRDFEKKDRWDHGGFEQLETEKKQTKKYEKPWYKRNAENNFNPAEKYEEKYVVVKETTQGEKGSKWQHDKFFETSSSQTQADGFKSKKPDKALYRAPGNRSSKTDAQRGSIQSNYSASQKSDKTEENADTPKASRNQFDLQSFDDRDAKNENDISSISNESTTHSEQAKADEGNSKLVSEDTRQKNSLLNSLEASASDKPLVPTPIFEFSVTLFDGRPAELRLFEADENGLETIIDAFCEACLLQAESQLHLKIMIIRCIKAENIFDPAKLEDLYIRLLSKNYDLIKQSSDWRYDENPHENAADLQVMNEFDTGAYSQVQYLELNPNHQS